jgi:hypothetical protein
MRCHAFAAAALIALTAAGATATDLPTSYLVDQKSLKAGVAGTQLTFELFTDAACTAPSAYSAPIAIESIAVISKLAHILPKGADKSPAPAELRTTLSGVTTPGNLWLQVTGTGIAPLGGACQAQAAQVAQNPSNAGALTSKAVVLAFSGGLGGQWGVETPASIGLPSPGGIVAVDRDAAIALQGLDTAVRYGCTIDLVSPIAPFNLNNVVVSRIDSTTTINYIPIFGLSNCAAACSNGQRDGKETGTDCGGDTPCARCPAGETCNTASDCASNDCEYCITCSSPICF